MTFREEIGVSGSKIYTVNIIDKVYHIDEELVVEDSDTMVVVDPFEENMYMVYRDAYRRPILSAETLVELDDAYVDNFFVDLIRHHFDVIRVDEIK